jgi:hypothetical protein
MTETAEAAWDAELQRRAAEIEEAQVIGKPAAQVFAELREKYPQSPPPQSADN